MKVIVPCAGKSSRYPNMKPKWMLIHPDGNMMVKKAIEGLDIQPKDVIITILREHEEKYNIVQGIKQNIGEEVIIVILDEQTKSQSETIYETLKRTNLREPFLIKDSDNIFHCSVNENFNYICYSDLKEYDSINPGNKSYIKMDDQRRIIDMIEKQIISTTFNVGGYFFTNPEEFMSTFERLNQQADSELYVSSIVKDMLKNQGKSFYGKPTTNYSDWGTIKEWSEHHQKFKTYFFDLDVLFKESDQFSKPLWEDAETIQENVQILKELSLNKYNQVYLFTSRPEYCRRMTDRQLKELEINYRDLVMGCFTSKKVIINNFSEMTKKANCEALSILKNSQDLKRALNI